MLSKGWRRRQSAPQSHWRGGSGEGGLDFTQLRERLVSYLMEEGIIRSPEVRRAMLTVPREAFVWPDTQGESYTDTPLHLGDTGQTISAPHMVAIMLEHLDLAQGQRVLEVGAGSGYSAALAAEIVAPSQLPRKDGHIITVERVPELADFARENLRRTGYADRVTVVIGDGTLGYPERMEEERYDRIVVTAAAPHVPRFLRAQLKGGGILLIPKGDLAMQTLEKIHKDLSGRIISELICECRFVPLIGVDGYR